MAGIDDNVFTSSPFKFVIEGNLLYIHAGLIAIHSKPRNRMINGHMAEAQQGSAELQDVDKGTFIRFIRWAYTGMYNAADFSNDSTPDSGKNKNISKKEFGASVAIAEVDVDTPPAESDPPAMWDNWGSSSRKAKKSKRVDVYDGPTVNEMGFEDISPFQAKEGMKKSFMKRKYDVPAVSLSQPQPRSNQGPLENHSEVFLSHARVYVFADKYDIKALRNLALHNLHQMLAIYHLYPERCRDIVALIRYGYTHTADRGEQVEDLRSLLTYYMGVEMAILVWDEEFKTLLLEHGGALLGDFLKMVAKRVE